LITSFFGELFENGLDFLVIIFENPFNVQVIESFPIAVAAVREEIDFIFSVIQLEAIAVAILQPLTNTS
jgi:hypothetical protein